MYYIDTKNTKREAGEKRVRCHACVHVVALMYVASALVYTCNVLRIMRTSFPFFTFWVRLCAVAWLVAASVLQAGTMRVFLCAFIAVTLALSCAVSHPRASSLS